MIAVHQLSAEALPIAILSVPNEKRAGKAAGSAGPRPRTGAGSPPSERSASWSPPFAFRSFPWSRPLAWGMRRTPRLSAVVSPEPGRGSPSRRSRLGRACVRVREGCMVFARTRHRPEENAAPGTRPGAGRMGRNTAFSSRSSSLRSGAEAPVAPSDDVLVRSDDIRRLGCPEGPVALRPSLSTGLPLSCHRRERRTIPRKSQWANPRGSKTRA